MKDIKIQIISNSDLPTHDCSGKCSGKNQGDGYCYHEDNTRHPVGACRNQETSQSSYKSTN
tara:strand:- start:1097 stop:1279 length:183 start_codon:yes stop_codon:yes gene_type:complete